MVEYICTKEIFFWLIAGSITGGVLIGLWLGELLNYIGDKKRQKKAGCPKCSKKLKIINIPHSKEKVLYCRKCNVFYPCKKLNNAYEVASK